MTSALLAQARALQWRQVPQDALDLAKCAADAASSIREAIKDQPRDGYLDIWYSPAEKVACVACGPWTSEKEAHRLRGAVCVVMPLADHEEASDWVKVATQPPGILFQKRAFSPTARAVGSAGGYFPDFFGKIPGVPSPLAATLASGALGAGLGYGTGWAAEKVLPDEWKRKRLRRTLAIMGGLTAAAPAMAWGVHNLSQQGLPGLVSGTPFDTLADTTGPFRTYTDGLQQKGAAFDRPFSSPGDTGAFPAPIDAEALVRSVYSTPVSQQLSPQMQAATAGLVVGAGHHQTGGSHMPRLVSPLAVGQMAAGMGSGWLSGMLVGKVLGALTGMPPSAQKRLQSTGLWAGAIANLVPLAFPGR